MANASGRRQWPTALTKVTPPHLPDVVERTRLYRLLDRARKRSIVWITAPPGFGKTTLVASYLRTRKLRFLWYQVDEGDTDLATFFHYLGSAIQQAAPRFRQPLPYLTPEYRQGLPTFTRRFFEELFGRLKPPGVLVFDNYQEVSPDAILHEMVAVGANDVPAGMSVMVISRVPPLAPFARLQANQKIHYFDQDALRLTKPESRAIVQLHTRSTQQAMPSGFMATLYDKAQGWVAGLVLLLEQAKTEPIPALLTSGQSPQLIFDYLAREVMKGLSPEVQQFLLKTAFLREMTAGMAQRLTGVASAGTILVDLHQSRYFTERRWASEYLYQYHPLFREFLLARARTLLPSDSVKAMRQAAASLLEELGRIEDAVALYRESGQTEEIVRLILSQAGDLLRQGRTQTLEGWLRELPRELYEHEPWLLYWLGVCRLSLDPFESEAYFERALEKFKVQKNRIGALLAWAGIVSSIQFSWLDVSRLDRWIDALEELLPAGTSFPSQEIERQVTFCMVTSLLWRRSQAALSRPWIERAKNLLERSPDIGRDTALSAALGHFCVFLGELDSAVRYMDLIRSAAQSETAPPLTRLVYAANEAVLAWHVGEPEESIRVAEQGLALSEKTGIHSFDGALLGSCVYGSLLQGDLGRAEAYLKKTVPLVAHPAHLLRANFLHLQAWSARLKGDLSSAWRLIQEGLDVKGLQGTLFAEALLSVAAAELLHELRDQKRATRYLDRCKTIAAETESYFLQWMIHLLESHFALDQGLEEAGLAALRDVLALGREKRFTFYPWWIPKTMSRLCAKALEAHIEVEYVQELIRKTRLVPDGQVSVNEAWPWPVKIYTMGRFEIHLNGELLPPRRKTPYRVLDLLKAVIAMGGGDISTSRLTDAIWPDSEGDAAQETFHKTLQRLRRLLNYDQLIQIRGTKVSLNREMCWVDALAFEERLSQGDGLEKARPANFAWGSAYEEAVGLYRGHFLGDDVTESWAKLRHDRLRQKFLYAAERLRTYWTETGDPARAQQIARSTYEVEPVR